MAAPVKPEGVEVAQGRWWSASEGPAITVSTEAAKALRVKAGAVMRWNLSGRVLDVRVAAVHRPGPQRLTSMVEFMGNPPLIESLPSVFYGAARVKPKSIAALQRDLYRRYPTVTVINVADILERVQEVVDQIAVVVRFISFFAVAAGVIILASSIAGTRFRRVREVAILKTLGATRGRIVRTFSAEFAVLGAVAGAIGSLLAAMFSNLLIHRLFDAPFRWHWPALLSAVVATAMVAVVAGWLASFRILDEKPLEVLRRDY